MAQVGAMAFVTGITYPTFVNQRIFEKNAEGTNVLILVLPL